METAKIEGRIPARFRFHFDRKRRLYRLVFGISARTAFYDPSIKQERPEGHSYRLVVMSRGGLAAVLRWLVTEHRGQHTALVEALPEFRTERNHVTVDYHPLRIEVEYAEGGACVHEIEQGREQLETVRGAVEDVASEIAEAAVQ